MNVKSLISAVAVVVAGMSEQAAGVDCATIGAAVAGGAIAGVTVADKTTGAAVYTNFSVTGAAAPYTAAGKRADGSDVTGAQAQVTVQAPNADGACVLAFDNNTFAIYSDENVWAKDKNDRQLVFQGL